MENFGVGFCGLDSRILLENRGIWGVVGYGKNWQKNLENI